MRQVCCSFCWLCLSLLLVPNVGGALRKALLFKAYAGECSSKPLKAHQIEIRCYTKKHNERYSCEAINRLKLFIIFKLHLYINHDYFASLRISYFTLHLRKLSLLISTRELKGMNLSWLLSDEMHRQARSKFMIQVFQKTLWLNGWSMHGVSFSSRS